ncbi:16S rRNA (uracil(1498)-N(3))-methyltransferase [Streptomyces sp. WMMB303]|uniref:16S rRNA (uracil(1498)-N(3))-methyltransferase n=1 Tax=Streptomyces sp. WMMB303 TaxID=3034154 RepID=UPI0023EC5E56|nr:16S rRNA (uracil(1498)-N(3))-methyltransferase [Streptomyces sp. WMMB303]MDF4250590.1 16S rRNA (uracil(1498)-N(3))-methyltransferase [Streptomyces sp. WMMB303]
MSAPVFLADAGLLRPGTVVLDGPEGRHAVAVRRLRPGEEVVLTDGAGTGAYGSVTAAEGKDRLEVAVREVRTEPAPRPRITVVQALPKGDRGELAVETMTETGVDAVVPWAASRAVTRWKGERAAKSLAKWRNTAREAGKQARRLRFPEVAGLAATREVAALLEAADFAAVLHEEGGTPLASAALPEAGEIVLVVGPEGGVAPEELEVFARAGAAPLRLGPSVLRTSTAGTAATAVLLARCGRWG